jgi:hypothetical protein
VFARLGRLDAEDPAEGGERDRETRQAAGDGLLQLPHLQEGLGKVVGKQGPPRVHAGPGPALVFVAKNVEDEAVAGLGPLDRDGPGERVDAVAVEPVEVRGG